MSDSRKTPLTYRAAGVDIDAGEALVEAIKPIAARTARPEQLGGLGGFGGCFQLAAERYREPVLVASTDGVGTKLRLVLELNRHDTIGIDLVAMCANDILVQGAEPLFFLDYFATAKLDPAVATTVIAGIGEGCRLAGMTLLGGETAEMPGFYAPGEYDLAGFAVGVVERTRLLDGSAVVAGDVLLGIDSSGPHANGYSLIRKVLERPRASLGQAFEGRTLGETLLAPTRIYVRALLQALRVLPVHALAHITGGGLPGNVPRVLPPGLCAVIDKARWKRPSIFDWLQKEGAIEEQELLRAFNCGIGMVMILPQADAARALALLRDLGESAQVIGEVQTQGGPERIIIR